MLVMLRGYIVPYHLRHCLRIAESSGKHAKAICSYSCQRHAAQPAFSLPCGQCEEYVNPCGNILYKRKLGCLQSRFYFTPQEMVGLGYASELAFSLKGLRLLPSFLPEAHIYGAGDWRVIIGSKGWFIAWNTINNSINIGIVLTYLV